MSTSHSAIVIGAGALGLATAYWLAASGQKNVLVLEQFELGHEKGASEDHSRIIRHIYHRPEYTRLTRAAYDTWADVEQESGLQLVHKTGGVDLAEKGSPGEGELANYRRSLDSADIPYEDLDADEIRSRWPQWNIEDHVEGLYQAEGGILDIRRAGAAHLGLATGLGVEFRPNTKVTGITSTDTHVTVTTSDGAFKAESVVLCVASWLHELAADLDLTFELTYTQEQVNYFATPHLREFTPDRFPTWIYHGEHVLYGFPSYGEAAVKAARDMGGRFITPEQRSYEPSRDEADLIHGILEQILPRAAGPLLKAKTCVYDMPPDREFVLDHLPAHPRVVFAIGAGHAAKFASLLGKIAAELVTERKSSYDIDYFRIDRPALTDAEFPATFRLRG